MRCVLALALAAAGACGGGSSSNGGSLLDGQIEFAGDPPALASLTYLDRDGATVTAEPVFAGWVSVRTAPEAPIDEVAAAVEGGGGLLIDAIPRVGLYTAEVSAGGEAELLGALWAAPVVVDAAPAGPIGPARLVVIDSGFSAVPGIELDCSELHGDCVAAVAGRGGTSVVQVDAGQSLADFRQDFYRVSIAPRIVRRVIEQLEAAGGAPLVVNLSFAPVCLGETWCVSRHGGFLSAVAQAIAAAPAARRDRVVVVAAAGNDGYDLDPALASAAAASPDGFARMKVVGASEDVGRATPVFNHAGEHMVFAPAESVEITEFTDASGTSFAAPEVARVLERVWLQVPGLDGRRLLQAFDQALADGGGRSLPVEPPARWTTDAFLCAFAGKARALAGEAAAPCASGHLAFEAGRNVGGSAQIQVDVIDLASGERWSAAPEAGFNHYLAGVSAAGLLVRVDEPTAGGNRRVVALADWGRGARTEVSAACPLAASSDLRPESVDVTYGGRIFFRATADLPGHPSGSLLPGLVFAFDPATGACTALAVDVDGDGVADDLSGSELKVARASAETLYFEEFVGSETALYAVAAAGGTARLLSAAYDDSLSVSADGSVAAFRDDDGELIALSTQAGTPVALAGLAGTTITSIDVGLDATGARAAVAGVQGLIVIDLGTGAARPVDVGFAFPLGLGPRFSVDGSRLIYSGIDPTGGGSPEGVDLFVVDVAGGTPQNTTGTADQAELNPVLR